MTDHAERWLGVVLASLAMAACGGENADPATAAASDPAVVAGAPAADPHAGHTMDAATGSDIDHAAGAVVEVDVDGKRIKLAHDVMENIGMSAMTMTFGVAGEIDLAAFEPGDDVRFMVKKGRDGSLRVMAICDAVVDGEDCLAALMDHADH